jgi:DsrE/DsrF-like family
MKPEMQGKKLGVLLGTSPAHANFKPVIALLGSALDAGVLVYLYCIDDGVLCVHTPEIQKLKQAGVNLFGCAYGAHRRNLSVDEAAAWSGLTVVADIIGGTDRFIAFT